MKNIDHYTVQQVTAIMETIPQHTVSKTQTSKILKVDQLSKKQTNKQINQTHLLNEDGSDLFSKFVTATGKYFSAVQQFILYFAHDTLKLIFTSILQNFVQYWPKKKKGFLTVNSP